MPFFWNCNIFVVWCMFPIACRCVAKCCAYLEARLLHRIYLLCSLNLVYKSGQSALRMPSRSLGILVSRNPNMWKCPGVMGFVIVGVVGYWLCGSLFLWSCIWRVSWWMVFLWLCMWTWHIFVLFGVLFRFCWCEGVGFPGECRKGAVVYY